MTASTGDVKRAAALSILDDLATELDKGFLEANFDIAGHQWTMRLLQDHERNWANGFVRNTSLNAMLTSVRAPVLAIGIRAIDGVPIPTFFQKQWEAESAEMETLAKQMLDAANPYVKQYWFAERLFVWLSQRPPNFVEQLWSKWTELESRREKAEDAMGKSSRPVGS
jgi:hypothetical protein